MLDYEIDGRYGGDVYYKPCDFPSEAYDIVVEEGSCQVAQVYGQKCYYGF